MRPTPQQISDSMHRVHAARREAWPPADFGDANVRGQVIIAWTSTWEQMRKGWVEQVENLIERWPFASSLAELEKMESELVTMLTDSASDFRLQMMSVLD